MKLSRQTLFFTVLVSLFTCGSMLAQIGAAGSSANKNRNDNEEIMNQFLKGIKKNADPSDNIDGTPYLEKDFQKAELVFPEGANLEALVRYNVAKEEMQVKIDEDGYKVLHPGVVVKFKHPFKMLNYRGEKKHLQLLGYFELLTPQYQDQKLMLLQKHKKEVRRGQAAAAMRKAKPPKYVDKDEFYIQFKDSEPVLVERRTKKFIQLFPEPHQEAIEEFMDENDLKSRDEQDLKSVVAFYNNSDF